MLYFDIRLQPGRPRTRGTHHVEIKHAHRINYIFCIKTAGVSGFASLFCTSLFDLSTFIFGRKIRIYSQFVKLRQGSGKDRQGMALKAKGLKA